ncbi:hypothetical protein GCM10010377_79190 [Streptomyces viridiviolaceus]|uniref:Uncharacterized protein n=1 Tax=Streptomyces viridiviolaceus TaxID=68282 RepID=A0ABW2E2J1_9ACTN|nr:hypothetical protein [Streptomyces viridiviolaceus]GHB77026.1 hypothetical protein GCM10010377_79190 [Streptomyces viridiviolaceus]
MNQEPGSVPVGVIVVVDPGRYAQTVDAARQVGLAVVSEQPILGSLSETIAENRILLLEAVDGVESVDRERIIRLPPPYSSPQ